jgi:hypothetical protein
MHRRHPVLVRVGHGEVHNIGHRFVFRAWRHSSIPSYQRAWHVASSTGALLSAACAREVQASRPVTSTWGQGLGPTYRGTEWTGEGQTSVYDAPTRPGESRVSRTGAKGISGCRGLGGKFSRLYGAPCGAGEWGTNSVTFWNRVALVTRGSQGKEKAIVRIKPFVRSLVLLTEKCRYRAGASCRLCT